VEDSSVVRRDIVRIEKETFLYCEFESQLCLIHTLVRSIHLLKLVTGVDISTLPVRTGGKDGNAVNSSRRIAAADPKSRAFCLSII
jgi:hypothetical protein